MPDTGAPWNIPYVENADLVREWPADSLLVANAVAAGLSAAGGLVEVKSAIFTGVQTVSATNGQAIEVTDLSITHEVANAANKLIISAFIGAVGTSVNKTGNVGIAIHDGTGLIAIGDTASNRQSVTAGGFVSTGNNRVVSMPSVTFVHTPGAGSKTYTVRAVLISDAQTVFINRSELDGDDVSNPRAVSSLVIQEVKV